VITEVNNPPIKNLIFLHECKQIMLRGQNNGQNNILELLIYINIVNLNQAIVMDNQRPHNSYLCNYSLRKNQVQNQNQLVWKPLKLLSTEFSYDILRTAKFQVKSSIWYTWFRNCGWRIWWCGTYPLKFRQHCHLIYDMISW
jgi:hypothetical protein